MTDLIFISIDPPAKAVVASDNTSITVTKSKVSSNIRELESTSQGTNNDNKETAINNTQGITPNNNRELKTQGNLGTWLNLGEIKTRN